jgi:hypothetical protein
MTVHAQRTRLSARGELEPQVVQDAGLDTDATKGTFSLVNENVVGQAFQQIGVHSFSSSICSMVQALHFSIKSEGDFIT